MPDKWLYDIVMSKWFHDVVMSKWFYDVAIQAIVGLFSGLTVGTVLLLSQHRLEKKLDRERLQRESQHDLLTAALSMYDVVSRTFAGIGSKERVATGWEQGHVARAGWAAVEAARDLPDDLVKVSRATREELDRDLLAILAMSRTAGDPPDEDRKRWEAISKRRRPFEPLEQLIAACKRTAP